jgi:type IV pilus assembly protein PilQ
MESKRMNRSTAFHHLRSALGLALACLAATFVMQGAQAADATGNSLQSIDVQTIGGKQVQLTMHLSGPAPEPMSFTIDKPARISLDLPGVTLALPSRRIDVASAGVDTVLAAEASGRTRVVLNLDAMQPYTDQGVAATTSIVTVGAGTAGEMAAAPAPAAASSSDSSAPAAASGGARSRASTSAAAKTAWAAWSCACPIRARRST